MQSLVTRRHVVAALVALVIASAAALRAQAVDVTGDWAFSVETGMGSGTPAITFKQDGEKLTGTYNGQLGSANFTGTVKGTAMKGAVSMAGGQLSGTFTGTKK